VAEGRAEERAITAWIADWVLDFAAPCYGPRGQSKLIDMGGGEGRLLKGASALRESGILHPDLQPYVELAAAVQEHAGDQATGALLLAARLVRNAVAAQESGVPAAAHLDGYALALRQARAQLAASARPDPEGAALASVVPARPGLHRTVLEGLRRLAADGLVPLDAIEVRAEAGEAEWLAGVVAQPQFLPRAAADGPVQVLLLADGWRPGPWKDGLSYRMTADVGLAQWTDSEDAMRRNVAAHVRGLGATLVACARELDPFVAHELARHGIATWNDASLSALERLERATGATRVAKVLHATKADLGAATWARRGRRKEGWTVSGAGPSCTLAVPAETAMAREAAKDDGERLLRAAGSHLRDPVAVPGGGRWQRALAQGLRRAADAAPGKTPLALRDAAKALDALADDLVRNLGLDPLEHPLPGDAHEVLDVAPSVRIAVVGAFEMALQVLRIDERLRKKASEGGWLRGGDKASLVEGGDVPPLM
jgi:chaperonin GroEL (HSP60 family)